MSQPPWIPRSESGNGAEEEPSYRGTHSSSDDASTPPADDLWGGPGTPGPWSGGADQPWASNSSTDPWAGARGAWSTDASEPDDSGPAFPVPGATPPANAEPGPAPAPDPLGADSPAPAP
ncbi:hypothetical protein ACXR2U_17015, partial [Jatrophihabitans sp. YIM 134969]